MFNFLLDFWLQNFLCSAYKMQDEDRERKGEIAQSYLSRRKNWLPSLIRGLGTDRSIATHMHNTCLVNNAEHKHASSLRAEFITSSCSPASQTVLVGLTLLSGIHR